MGELAVNSISEITLTNFRNHKYYHSLVSSDFVVFCAPNGSGKTSVIEAISLLIPGRGFRASNFAEICTYNQDILGQVPWQSRFVLDDGSSLVCSYQIEKKRKHLCRDDDTLINAQDLLEKMRILWLVPEMDSLFIESSAVRRRFLDRMVYSFFPWHATNCAKYNHYLKSRLRLLKAGCVDDVWLRGIESSLSVLALNIACARVIIAQIVSLQMENLPADLLGATMKISGAIEAIVMELVPNLDNTDLLDFCSSLSDKVEYQEILALIQSKFQNHRTIDSKVKQSTFGIHRSDIIVHLSHNNLNAKFCSTGEQKILLLTLLLGHSIRLDNYLRQNKQLDARMVLLLDDALAYLDKSRQASIITALDKLNAQVFLTTSDVNHAETIKAIIPRTQLVL